MSSNTQPAPETDEKKSRGLGGFVLWGLVVVMVYVLSSGPVLRFTGVFVGPSRSPIVAIYFYYPLWWTYRWTPLRTPLGMYWHIWRPKLFDKNGDMRVRSD
jgi:hypothetical protein